MKKPYSLDYSIERDTERVAAIKDILNKLEKNPSNAELEQMGSYILCGKDAHGYNAVQRGEIYLGNTRYNSFRRKDDKLLSLDALLENPLTDQQQLRPTQSKDIYVRTKPAIRRPKYDKKTGELIDPGDSMVPGIQEIWEAIDRLEHWIAVLEGKIPPDDKTPIFDDSYHLYRLKHYLIDLRRQQYYLKDSYNPPIYFLALDHPKAQFVNWCEDCFYWIPMDEWQKRVDNALTHLISKNIKDYEVRETSNGPEVKWVIRRHTFDWENPKHIRAFINNYESFYTYMHEKLDTYGRAMIFDFEHYRELAHFTPVREFLIDCRIRRFSTNDTLDALEREFGMRYNENHLCTIYTHEIPDKIALTVTKERIAAETKPEDRKKCLDCGRLLPRHKLFFSHNRNRKDGYAPVCKECEKSRRILGGQSRYDQRKKEPQMHAVQARQAGN